MSQQKKVDRLVQKYGLQGLTDELADRRAEGASYRDLAEVVNTRVVQEVVRGTSLTVDETLGVLTGESVSGRATVARRLEGTDVDIDELEGDLISHTSVRTYVRSELDVEKRTERESEDYLEYAEWALRRAEAIGERQIERLERDGRLEGSHDPADIEVEAELRFYDVSGAERTPIPVDELVVDERSVEGEEPRG